MNLGSLERLKELEGFGAWAFHRYGVLVLGPLLQSRLEPLFLETPTYCAERLKS